MTTRTLPRRRRVARARLRPRARAASARRGVALLLVLVLTVGMAALVLGAIHVGANATLLGRAYDREQDFKYAADAAVAIGKSQLNHDPYALPDTGYRTLLREGAVVGADGRSVPGLVVNVYAGPTGSTTGQFGRFASVVAEARDLRGARWVRRLEVTQESFARFAYWSNRETQPNGDPIYFAGGDQLWGPVWSNDAIQVGGFGGATFHDVVGTARTIVGKGNGVFKKPYQENQDRIELPTPAKLGRLPGFAASGRLRFDAPTDGNEQTARLRLEFVALDLSQPADGDSTDADEGFVRAYTAYAPALAGGVQGANWLRGDYTAFNCGDWHNVAPAGSAPEWRFFPAAVHRDAALRAAWRSAQNGTLPARHRDLGGTRASPGATDAQLRQIMGAAAGQTQERWLEPGAPAPRCFLGGDPHLAPVERSDWAAGRAGAFEGGSPRTFTARGRYGEWAEWGGAPYAPLEALAGGAVPPARRRTIDEVRTAFPLGRGANPGTMGVLYVKGTAGVSGVLRGKVTIYASAHLVVLDDARYATDPAATDASRQAGRCADVLGLLADRNVVVADNALLTPQTTDAGVRALDDTPRLDLHAVVMAMQTSFVVEDYDDPPANASPCEASPSGRGCLYLVGGVIQDRRGAVGTAAGTGFVKRYSYDRCAAVNPPPYFPTTGRFEDNRYYEIDPVRFDVAALFRRLTPSY